MFKGLALAALAATFAAFILVGSASAQYPQPRGSLVCATRAADEVKSTETKQSTISATLRDSAGKPVSGATVYFQITAGSGNLTASAATTNGNGVAVVGLHGEAAVTASYDGLACRSADHGSIFTPPSTGEAGLAAASRGSSGAELVFGLALVVMAASGTGIVILRRRRVTAK